LDDNAWLVDTIAIVSIDDTPVDKRLVRLRSALRRADKIAAGLPELTREYLWASAIGKIVFRVDMLIFQISRRQPGGGSRVYRVRAAQKKWAARIAYDVLEQEGVRPTIYANGSYFRLADAMLYRATGKRGDCSRQCIAHVRAQRQQI